MNRTDLVNYILKAKNYASYLEIGTNENQTFAKVDVPYKIGVDPVVGGTHRMTSDEFFAHNSQPFDLVFIDGDHSAEQVYKDAINALSRTYPNGCVVFHDCLPPNEQAQSLDANGTVWKVIADLLGSRAFDIAVGDFDFGCGVMFWSEWGKQHPDIVDYLVPAWRLFTWRMLENSKDRLLHLLPWPLLQVWIDDKEVA